MVGMEKEMRPVGGRASEKVDKNMNFATCRLSKKLFTYVTYVTII